ncbi:GTPase Obg [Egicoccus halophilus]|uniref:GTPase Obg n=1 Tax=Egicoccus halophilus TaxID=1670830 RepID=A0A8J3A8Q5_9ACTN|nr:GTPase Obg [Egicoccus halophilus]
MHVRGGDGGNGSVSMRREAHVPRGGPDGGDGGRGGDVVLVADRNTTSLLDLHRTPHRRGGNGGHGSGQNRTGAEGRDEVIPVPLGTVVRERDTGVVLADLVTDGQRWVAGRGGRGGRGNAAFATRYRRLPRFAERGEKVTDRSLRLELKVIADVGLVGFPSAGKSSLVSRLSSARPRIEAWPFTTLTPHLGVMRAGSDAEGQPIDVVLADVPGLIEGAAEGKGLGIQFLRHIERCLVLLHVLDAVPMEPDRDPVRDLAVLREELRRHDPTLLERPQLVVLNKLDLPDGEAMADLVLEQLTGAGEEVLTVSAISGVGLDALRYRLGALVAAEREVRGDVLVETVPSTDEEVVLRLSSAGERDFTVTPSDEGYVVTGERMARWVQMLPLEDWEAVRYLQGRLRRAGVEKALVDAGARKGDEVVIGDLVFDFDPDLDDLPAEEREAILAGEHDPEDVGDDGLSDDGASEEEERGDEPEVGA